MERGPQAAREVVECHARGGDLPSRDQPPDELAVSVLAQRIECDPATREANGVRERAGRFGVGGQLLEHVPQALAVRLARVVDPFGVESRQQLTVAEADGLLEPPLPGETLELPGVHRHVLADEADHVAGRDENALARRAQRVADGDELGSQALARARVEHVRPEATSHLRASVHARIQGEPAEQRACPPALGHRQRNPIRLEREGAEEAHAEHGDRLSPTGRCERLATRLRPCGVRVALGWQGRVPGDKTEGEAMAATATDTKVVYELEGTLLEACSCGVLCPCWIGEDPDGGTCDAFNAYHFDRGTIRGVDVSGLSFVRVVHIPGNVLTPASWKQVVFIDERASDDQRQAILDAYDGKLGGPLADLAGLIGETLGVERAAITHEVHDGKGRLAIGDAVHSEMHPYIGPDGSTTTLRDSLFSTVPGSPAYVAVADKHEVRLPQYGMQWSWEGRNAIQADYRIRHAA
jgi:hypothetical protein